MTRKAAPAASSPLDRFSSLQLDLLSLAFLYVITLVLFRGIVFQNAVFSTEGDTLTALAYEQAGNAVREAEQVDPLWTPYIFSGMPSFGNVMYIPHTVSYLQTGLHAVLNLLYLNTGMAWMLVHYLLGGIFMFLLVRTLGFSRLPALFAAVTFMLNPYAIALAQEGHGSKLQALSYLPLLFLLTHQLLTKRTLLWFGLFAAGVGTMLLTNHMQIVYYALLVVGLYVLVELVREFRTGAAGAVRSAALATAGLLVGMAISAYIYLSVYEYSQYSIRGGGAAGVPGGLSWDYATNWSMHPAELITFLIPSFFGFSSALPYIWQGEEVRLPLYWGSMPFNTSTVYAGLLPIILGVIALTLRRTRLTLFFGGLTLLIVLMSLGKHFEPFYRLLFNVLPFFDKFRAPVMILHLAAFTGAVLGGAGLAAVLETAGAKEQGGRERLGRGLLWALGAVWAVFLVTLLFRSGIEAALPAGMFQKAGESYAPQILEKFREIRADLLWADVTRTALFATAGLGLLLLFLRRKLSEPLFGAALLGILILDLGLIGGKFINPTPAVQDDLSPDATVRFLKAEPGLFRIFPLGELFMEKRYMYHTVQSIGGYNPAKLKVYQTMIDSCLYRGADPAFPLNMNVVNMLNARYLLATGRLPEDRFELVHADEASKVLTYRNPGALPRAFFVREAVAAAGDSEVFARMNDPAWNPAVTAILEASPLPAVTAPDSAAAEVTSFGAHRIEVDATTSSPALLVLGEVYYRAGWRATVDGVETPILKTNSVLRSVVVPAGRHRVEFTFDPPVYRAGWTVTHVAWGIAVLAVVLGVLPALRRRFRKPA